MPCFQIQLVSVEFKAAHADLLEKAIKALGWQPFAGFGRSMQIMVSGGRKIVLDLATGKASLDPLDQDKLNLLKRTYSRMAVFELARRNGWQVQATGTNKGVFARAF